MEVTYAADGKRFVSLSSKSIINNNNNNNIRPHSQPTYSISQLTTTNLVIPPNMPSLTPGLRFLALPSELRLQVYDDYFSKCSRLDARQILLTCPRQQKQQQQCHAIPYYYVVSKQVSNEVPGPSAKAKATATRLPHHVASRRLRRLGYSVPPQSSQDQNPDDYAM